MLFAVLLVLPSIIFLVAAQMCLKAAAIKLQGSRLQCANKLELLVKSIFNLFIITAFFLYAIGFILWLVVLSKLNVSVAYPMMSLGYVLNAIVAYFLFKEPLSKRSFMGIVIIMLGIYLITYHS